LTLLFEVNGTHGDNKQFCILN